MLRLAVLVVLASLLSSGHAVDSLRFLVIGDMGGLPVPPYTTPVEVATARQMAKVADRYSPQFILELGDNFYYDGVKNVDDKRFKETFEDVYTAPSLQVPWYLVAGNHDHNGNVSAQIAYSQKSKRWNFPNYWYLLNMPIPGGATLDLVMMDTVILSGNVLSDFHGDKPRGPANPDLADSQWQWIETSLEKSTSTYLFTAGHYPVYSVAEHGPTQVLVDKLLPMLKKYKANGHMCGHDHNLQHLRTAEGGQTLDFILSGSANFIDVSTAHQNAVPSGSSLFHWADLLGLGGFLYVEATASNTSLTYMEASGKVLYRTNVFPRKM